MHQYSSITRAAERLIAYVKEHAIEKEISSIDEIMPLMDTLQQIFPGWMVVVCPLHNRHTRYVTDNCQQIIGYSASYFMQDAGHLTFYSHVIEEDREEMADCFTFLHEFLQQIPPAEFSSYRFIFHYRYQHNDGTAVYLHDEKASLGLNNQQYIHYSIIKTVGQGTLFPGVKVEVFKQDKTLRKITECKPASKNVRLSKRETELVELLRNGLTTKEMAYRLNISHHTVRNIRQKLFGKYNVNNSIELLNKTVLYN
jgi:DNA-binding CsgD family transcriptional regulator